MTQLRPLVWAVLAVLLAVVLQGRLGHAAHIRWAQPDLALLTLACAGVLLGRSQATFLGFWAGLLTAAMVPTSYGAFLASRVIAGALSGYLTRYVIRDSLAVPPLAVLTVTLTAEIAYVLIEPSAALHAARVWCWHVGGECLYNAVLAIPVYFLLRRLGLGLRPDDPFGVRY